MATIEDLKAWIERDLSRWGDLKSYLDMNDSGWSIPAQDGESRRVRLHIYTNTNKYTIQASERRDGGYLGAGASSRKPRAGEDWTRGNDLADGKLSEETWHRILGDIVKYEMVRIAKKPESGPLLVEVSAPVTGIN